MTPSNNGAGHKVKSQPQLLGRFAGQVTGRGWRGKVADAAARKAPARDDYVRAGFGFLFLALSLAYLAKTARRLAARS